MALIAVLAGSYEAYTLVTTSPRVAGSRALSPEMKLWGHHSPEFGDNTFMRRESLSAAVDTTATTSEITPAQAQWYYDGKVVPTQPYETLFGDNALARKTALSTPSEDTPTTTEVPAAAQGWYYDQPHVAPNSYSPAFGDNTYARRASLSGGA